MFTEPWDADTVYDDLLHEEAAKNEWLNLHPDAEPPWLADEEPAPAPPAPRSEPTAPTVDWDALKARYREERAAREARQAAAEEAKPKRWVVGDPRYVPPPPPEPPPLLPLPEAEPGDVYVQRHRRACARCSTEGLLPGVPWGERCENLLRHPEVYLGLLPSSEIPIVERYRCSFCRGFVTLTSRCGSEDYGHAIMHACNHARPTLTSRCGSEDYGLCSRHHEALASRAARQRVAIHDPFADPPAPHLVRNRESRSHWFC